MKIITRAVYQMTPSGYELLEEDSHEYEGPIAEAKGGSTPDPVATGQAQTATNQATAAYNNAMAHGNTTTPLGSETYTSRIDPTTGATVYDSNVTLTPAQQQLLDQQNQQDLALGNTAQDMLGTVNDTYSTPMDTSTLPKLYGADDLLGARTQTQDALYGKQTAYLDPKYDAMAKALETKLANQGIGVGSEAWKASTDDLMRDKAFNYDQARTSAIAGGGQEMALLSGLASGNRSQLLSEALTKRAQPMNEFNALRTASQIQMPQFNGTSGGTPQTQPADISGSIWNAYNANQANAASNTQAGVGLLGTAATAAAMFF